MISTIELDKHLNLDSLIRIPFQSKPFNTHSSGQCADNYIKTCDRRRVDFDVGVESIQLLPTLSLQRTVMSLIYECDRKYQYGI